jgi:acetylornithine/N-succinyldiaminopimelate aminotransferase
MNGVATGAAAPAAAASLTGNSPVRAPEAEALLGVYRPAGPWFVGGRGCFLVAEDGREYLDFASGIGVNALGYGDPAITAAIEESARKGLIHTSNLFRTHAAAELASVLVAHAFPGQVFFCNSGAEANEAAFKFARRAAREVGGPAKHEIVALRGSFHGRLFGALAATDRPGIQEPFQPLMPGVRFVGVGDEAQARAAISLERTAAIIAEPVQGEGGVKPLDPGFLRLLRELADQARASLIFDEVQCGLGRTGELFAFQKMGVQPDLLTLAKPLAGGLPMGAVLAAPSVAEAVRAGDHATTFGGGPLVSSVALAVLKRVAAPGFLAAVRNKGAWLGEALHSLLGSGRVREVRGVGLMWGLELESEAAPVVARALEMGLLVTSAGERVVRLLPPLTIGTAELELGVARLSDAIASA